MSPKCTCRAGAKCPRCLGLLPTRKERRAAQARVWRDLGPEARAIVQDYFAFQAAARGPK